MRTQPTSANEWPQEITAPNGVLCLSGIVRASVWRGRLRLESGFGAHRQVVLVHRATGGLKRLMIRSDMGSISLAAIQWVHDIKAVYVQIGRDAELIAVFGPPGSDRPALRRAQARALGSADGLEIARGLIHEKIAGQRATLVALSDRVRVDPNVVGGLDEQLRAAMVARTPNELLLAEAKAASNYWCGWSRLPVRFGRRDARLVARHWTSFGARSSPLSSGPRLAVNPANALLNYLYAILESETTIACRIVGLDVGLGIFHVDQDNRQSLSDDLMEPLRPIVDRYLLDLLATRTFAASDFFETATGVCRLTSSLARQLWSIAPEIGMRVGRVAEDVAAQLDGGKVRTPVTGRRRQDARPFGRRRVTPLQLDPPTKRTCLECGAETGADRLICNQCAPEWRQERDAKFIGSGPRRLAALRVKGEDPTKTAEALEKVRENRIRRHEERLAWERANGSDADPHEFRTEILPRIQTVSIRRLSAATGLSLRYCALIRRGERVPHPRWWEPLRDLART